MLTGAHPPRCLLRASAILPRKRRSRRRERDRGLTSPRPCVGLATAKHPGIPCPGLVTRTAARLRSGDRSRGLVACGLMHQDRPRCRNRRSLSGASPRWDLRVHPWATDDELLRVVSDAVAAHGSTDRAVCRPAPAADADSAIRTSASAALEAHGFSGPSGRSPARAKLGGPQRPETRALTTDLQHRGASARCCSKLSQRSDERGSMQSDRGLRSGSCSEPDGRRAASTCASSRPGSRPPICVGLTHSN